MVGLIDTPDGWNPLATIPRDGTVVWAIVEEHDFHHHVRAIFWCGQSWLELQFCIDGFVPAHVFTRQIREIIAWKQMRPDLPDGFR